MKIVQVQGNKGNDDRIIMINTNGMEQMSITSLLELIKAFFDNEDRIYPNGKGRWYLLDSINQLCNGKEIKTILSMKKTRHVYQQTIL